MARKLLVVTAGTVAAGVGLELLEQMKEHPSSELNLMVRFIDTAYLPNHYETLKAGEWFQMSIEPEFMKTLYEHRGIFPRLQTILYPGLLPGTGMTGSGGIRYNGAAAAEVQREKLREWLSSCMVDLARSADGNTNISVALIISAVGGTGSGSIEHLIDIIIDAANYANIRTTTEDTLRCDVFILQPGFENVTDLGLANTLALYAELAASQLTLSSISSRHYLGRKIIIGWGSEFVLSSLEQLLEAAATIIRVTNVPTYGLVAEFQEREIDTHVLRELDPLTNLPTHLSLATVATISLGHLEAQVVQQDTAYMIDKFIYGKTLSSNQTNIFLAKLADALAGESADARYRNLLTYLSENIPFNRIEASLDATAGNKSISARESSERLIPTWREYKEEIRLRHQSVQDRGKVLVADTIDRLERTKREYLSQGKISLSELREEFQTLQIALATTLVAAREDIQTTV